MFADLGWEKLLLLVLIGFFVFGPDRLPKVARDAGRLLRELRRLAAGAQEDLRAELGPEFADFDVRSLHPRTFIREQLLNGDDLPLRSPRASLRELLAQEPQHATAPAAGAATATAGTVSMNKPADSSPGEPDGAGQRRAAVPFDVDAT